MNGFATIQPGLEAVLVAELRGLGVRATEVPGGARFPATPAEVARVCRTARTPSTVLIELAEGPARTPEDLVALVRRVRWRDWLRMSAKVEVVATAKRARLRFRDAVEGRVSAALAEARRGPGIPEREQRARVVQTLRVRIEEDRALLSLDAAGQLLHFRGWRKETGGAPLRENLAAAMLSLARWAPGEPLLDPFCGSGTIPIEAALIAAGRSPFVRRSFACDEWPGIAPIRERPVASRHEQIFGADRDPRVLSAAAENAARAGVELRWLRADIAEIDAPAATGLVLANPPWGQRLGQDVTGVYHAFGRTLRERFSGWRAVFLCPDPQLARRVDPGVQALATFPSGGIRATLWGRLHRLPRQSAADLP